MYQGAAHHNAVLPGATTYRWIVKTGRNNGALSFINDRLVLTTMDGAIHAFDVRGNPLWSQKLSNVAMSTPVSDGNIVVVGTGKSGALPDGTSNPIWGIEQGDDVLAFQVRDGAPLWSFHTQGEDMPSAAIVGSNVVFGNGDKHEYGLSLADGKRLWRNDLLGLVTMSPASEYGGTVYLSDCRTEPYSCETVGVEPSSGHQRYRVPYGGSDCSPTVTDDLVFTSETQDYAGPYRFGGIDIVTATDRQSGRLRWQYRSRPGPYVSLATQERAISGTFFEGVYYQSTPVTDEMIAFDAASGAVRWRLRTMAPVKMSPVVTNGRVIFGDVSGVFYEVDAATGDLVSAAPFPQPFSSSPPLVIGPTVYVSNGDYLYAFPVAVGYY